MKNIVVIYGTRPEEIKLYPFTKHNYYFVRVNQSKDLKQNLIIPNIEIEEEELEGYVKYLKKEFVSAVMVQGDTRTAFRAAIYAFEAKIPVIHIEAGMRTFDLTSPFPEEGYRQMIDVIASYKYSSTKEAAKYCDGMYVGQTSIDTLFEFMPHKAIEEDFYIVTVHRNESYDRLPEIIKVLKKMDDSKLVIFAHPNRVGQELKKHFNTRQPLQYEQFVELLSHAKGCISDSGGLQEECIALDKEFISLRDKTERGHGEKYERGATKKIVNDLKRRLQ